MNQLIAAAKSGRGHGNAYSRLKAKWTDAIVAQAAAQGLPAFIGRVEITWEWREKDQRRDPDNVAAGGRKLVLDGLVRAGVLPGDGWRYVRSWEDRFLVVDAPPGPGVRVLICDA